MPIFETIVYGVVIPALVAGIILLAAWLRAGDDENRLAHALAAFAFIASLATANTLLFGLPALPPVLVEEWLLLAALAAAITGGFAAAKGLSFPARMFLAAPLFAVVAFVIAAPGNEYLWREMPGWFAVAALASAGYFIWAALERRAASERGAALPFLLMLALAGSALSLLLAGSLKFGQLGVVLASIGGAAWVVALWQRRMRLAPGWLLPFSVTQMALLGAAAIYASLPLYAGVAHGLAGLVPAATGLLRRNANRSPIQFAAEIVLVLALSGLGVWLTFQSSPPFDPNEF